MRNTRAVRCRRAFTLIDAATVCATATVLATLAAPSLIHHREAARSDECTHHMRMLHSAFQTYVADFKYLPASYVYAAATTGTSWQWTQQVQTSPNPANGYIHWSGVFLARGYVTRPEIFGCPSALRSGAPATNPGPNPAHWEPQQINDVGSSTPGALPHDRQAPRLAYTANGALIPRNKFVDGGSPRKNEFVLADDVTNPASTILLTEWLQTPALGWRALADENSRYKTHRPVTPFVGISAGVDVYNEPTSGSMPRFTYPSLSSILPPAQVQQGSGVTSQFTSLNAVARKGPLGLARFVFLDGHVENTTVQDTITRRLWGDRFYSITGNDAVTP